LPAAWLKILASGAWRALPFMQVPGRVRGFAVIFMVR